MNYLKQTEFYVRKYRSSDYQEVQEIFYNGTSGIFRSAVLNLWNGDNLVTLIFHLIFFIFCLFITTWKSWIIGASLFLTFEGLVIFSVYDVFYNRARYEENGLFHFSTKSNIDTVAMFVNLVC